jgi:uncharacterized membrane protein HdeD (DUF308 family)
MRTFGIILVIVGLAMLFVPGFDFISKEKVIDAGPIQVTADKKNEIGWPTYAGGVVAAIGVVLLVAGKKK